LDAEVTNRPVHQVAPVHEVLPVHEVVGGAVDDLPPPAPAMYDFVVPSFRITTTRSLENDTDFASLAIAALAADGTTLQTYGPVTQSLGDLGNGTHGLDLALRGIEVPGGGSLGIVFTIANKGSSSVKNTIVGDLNTVCAGIVGALASGQLAGIATSGTPAVAATATSTAVAATPPAAIAIPLWEAAVGAALAVGLLDLITILFADCDGWVVNATMQIGSLELQQMASQAPWEWTTDYPGSDSPTGCGANSNYVVDYEVYASSLAVTVPNVLGFDPPQATTALSKAGLTVNSRTAKANVDLPQVITQSPSGGSIVPRNTVVSIEVGVPEGGNHPIP
jgi:PASTA domain